MELKINGMGDGCHFNCRGCGRLFTDINEPADCSSIHVPLRRRINN